MEFEIVWGASTGEKKMVQIVLAPPADLRTTRGWADNPAWACEGEGEEEDEEEKTKRHRETERGIQRMFVFIVAYSALLGLVAWREGK